MFADGKTMRTTIMVVECVGKSKDVEVFAKFALYKM